MSLQPHRPLWAMLRRSAGRGWEGPGLLGAAACQPGASSSCQDTRPRLRPKPWAPSTASRRPGPQGLPGRGWGPWELHPSPRRDPTPRRPGLGAPPPGPTPGPAPRRGFIPLWDFSRRPPSGGFQTSNFPANKTRGKALFISLNISIKTFHSTSVTGPGTSLLGGSRASEPEELLPAIRRHPSRVRGRLTSCVNGRSTSPRGRGRPRRPLSADGDLTPPPVP